MRSRNFPFLFLFTIGLILSSSLSALEPVRPLTPAERAAVELVSDFLIRGSDAFANSVASSSAWSSLEKEALRNEIETRTGPPDGAVWELQTSDGSIGPDAVVFAIGFPSGIEDILTFHMVDEGGTYRIDSIESLSSTVHAEPSPILDPSSVVAASSSVPSFFDVALGYSKMAAVVLAAFLIFFAVLTRKHRRVAIPSFVVALLLFVGVFAGLTPSSGASTAGSEDRAAETESSHVSPAELRRSLALGGSGDLKSSSDDQDDREKVWVAQAAVQAGRLDEAKAILDGIPSPSPMPLADLIRARVAVIESDAVGAALAYSRVLEGAPFADHLWIEAAEVCLMFGLEDRGEEYVRHVQSVGSRSADTYYRAASLAVVDRKPELAKDLLRRAIQLAPATRGDLIEAGFFWEFLRDGEIARLVNLHAPEEAIIPASQKRGAELKIGPSWKAYQSGDLLYLRSGDRKLVVPGGAAHAPSFAQAVDAKTLQMLEYEAVKAEADRLFEVASNGTVWYQPALRRRLELLCHALASEDRWEELIRLTQAIPLDAAESSMDPLVYRMIALKFQKREDESRMLAAKVALAELQRSRPSAAKLLQLGEVLAMFGEYDIAINLLKRASTISETSVLEDRIRQLSMNRQLSSDYEQTVTEHFDLRYPTDTQRSVVAKLPEILEAERKRLAPLFGVDLPRIRVNVFHWDDFQTVYTHSNQILGFFDGTINLPFADVPYFVPQVVSVLTHELTHAFVTEATNGNAPQWFQEGFAQRLEMVEASPNAFNRLGKDNMLALLVLDPTLRSSPDPEMLSVAYIMAETFIRFLEDSYGKDVSRNLIKEFARGASSEVAIETVCGKTIEEIDNDFRTWGWEKERLFLNPDPIVYDVDPASEVKLHRGRPKGYDYNYNRRRSY